MLLKKLKSRTLTVIEAAAMSAHIYNCNMQNSYEERRVRYDNATLADWRLINVIEGSEGMKMGIYIREDDDWSNPAQYSVVFKGTTWYDLRDWKNDIQQIFTPKSVDMWDAINYSKMFVAQHSQKVTFVGHSKGGAEATASAVATNCDAIIFNPANSKLSNYGLKISDYNKSITAYIVKGEIVDYLEKLFSKPIDKVVYLSQQYGGHWYEAWRTTMLQRIQNHSISTVMLALKKDGYYSQLS